MSWLTAKTTSVHISRCMGVVVLCVLGTFEMWILEGFIRDVCDKRRSVTIKRSGPCRLKSRAFMVQDRLASTKGACKFEWGCGKTNTRRTLIGKEFERQGGYSMC